MKFYCIADSETARGFGLAGIAARVAETAEQAQAAIHDALSLSDCGVIIITEEAASLIRQQIEAIRMEGNLPLIVEIPGPGGPLPGRKGLREFVQEAVGMNVG